MADKNLKPKKENRIKRWWRETVGELRKVNWPTTQEAVTVNQDRLDRYGRDGRLIGRAGFCIYEIDCTFGRLNLPQLQ